VRVTGGPTVDGRILPRHPFDPGAPEISADVPLLTGSNLHDGNGLDRPKVQAMQMDELHRLVSQEFGERSKEIIDDYRRVYPRATPFDLYATIAASSVRRPAREQATRKAALGRASAYSYPN
jgi:para-nitrobenzyl esterase